MAKTQKDLDGWEYILADENEGKRSSRNRSRRGGSESIFVRRQNDGMELKPGDTVLIHQQQDDSSEIAFIKDFKLGGAGFLDMTVTWFMRSKDIDLKNLPDADSASSYTDLRDNEIFITAYLGSAYLDEVVEKVNVLSSDDFKNIVLDDSISSSTFLCRRGCDNDGEVFSQEFDFNKLKELFTSDSSEFINHLRDICLPAPKSAKKKVPGNINEVLKKASKPKNIKKKLTKLENSSSSEAEDLDDDDFLEDGKNLDTVDIDEEEEDDDDEVDDDEIEEEDFTPKRTSKRKSSYSPSPKKSPSKKKIKLPSDMLGHLLSPRRSIKADSSKPSPSSLSPKKKDPSCKVLGIDSTSQAFRDIKSKLHASHRIATLPGREDEYASLFLNLETAIQEGTGCCIYVSGTPGVGKTATVREVIAQLEDSTRAGDMKDFDYLEINGLKLLSPNVAYEVLWERISGHKVSSSNASILLEKHFTEKGNKKPLVVLMDELDQIVTKKQNVMYNFFNWPTYSNSKLIVVAIANTMDLPERILSNKISSRLGLRRIQFIGYTYEQLGDIIKHRLNEIQKEIRMKVLVKEDAIAFASRKVASVSGDARRALTICRRAVEIAEQDFLNQVEKSDPICYVQISHISRAINETVNSPISAFLSSLSFSSKLLLGAVLLRMKRSGLAENTLGDIIDEMNISIKLFITKDSNHKQLEDLNTSLVDLLYGGGLIYEPESGISNIRIHHFKHILNELVENGILNQQNILSERYRSIHLNVSEEEVTSVLKRDKDMMGFF